MRATRTARTLLEQKIWERRQTFEEFAEYAEVFARNNKESGTLSVRHLQRLVAGRGPKGQPLSLPRPATVRLLEHIFGLGIDELLAPLSTSATDDDPRTDLHQIPQISGSNAGCFPQLDQVRRGLHDLMTEQTTSSASLDDWELLVVHYGAATKDRPAALLLNDLVIDVAELNRTMAQSRSLSVLRRLTPVAANLSGLMCLTLIKLDDRHAFRRWARTARIAAREADDATTYSWVLAQEAYGHFYSNDLHAAVQVAQHAQAVVPTTPCVGAVLAAALEARAQAALGRADETRNALQRAEVILSDLNLDTGTPSAFVYDEAQFRFHESNALTHLGDTKAAWLAQERALELVAPRDFMDRAFTRLDRALCLMADGDASGAIAYALDTLLDLSEHERQGIISGRAWQITNALPAQTRTLPAVAELRDLLMVPAR